MDLLTPHFSLLVAGAYSARAQHDRDRGESVGCRALSSIPRVLVYLCIPLGTLQDACSAHDTFRTLRVANRGDGGERRG
ncbi:hypothetical protein BDN71DRAFT_1445355 [Pleurotus eryngii]|uniref:Uncharacterized protein n=1 Tax=Pleurotus eryngii TaxID=5323 RepID=A0A9P6DHW3_PLEER|nr:hypothetical protein BDN71DRAFT_1445355 [Pleurotus eryngii]